MKVGSHETHEESEDAQNQFCFLTSQVFLLLIIIVVFIELYIDAHTMKSSVHEEEDLSNHNVCNHVRLYKEPRFEVNLFIVQSGHRWRIGVQSENHTEIHYLSNDTDNLNDEPKDFSTFRHIQ